MVRCWHAQTAMIHYWSNQTSYKAASPRMQTDHIPRRAHTRAAEIFSLALFTSPHWLWCQAWPASRNSGSPLASCSFSTLGKPPTMQQFSYNPPQLLFFLSLFICPAIIYACLLSSRWNLLLLRQARFFICMVFHHSAPNLFFTHKTRLFKQSIHGSETCPVSQIHIVSPLE